MNFLSVVWDVSPEIFSIGPVSIRWYSLMFVIGFYLGVRLFIKFFKKEGVSLDLIDPLLLTMVIATAVGARLGHVFFYQPEYYLAHPIEILQIWKGGLASHGGAVAILLALWWFVHKYGKKNGFDYLWLLDRICITVALCGGFIRIGNLINSEIFGDATTLPWGFEFVRSMEWHEKLGVPCHPTQIYESLAYFLSFAILYYIYLRKSDKFRRGFIFGLFFVLVFGVRFLVEFIKMPQVDEEIGMFLNIGQLLSIPCIIAGIALMVYAQKHGKPMLLEAKEPYDYRKADFSKKKKQ